MGTLGQRVNEIRKKNKLTQATFGEQLGISQTHVSKIEKDIENPSDTLLLFISYKYSIDIDWLRTGNGDPELMQGASEEGMINRYHATRYDFEKILPTMISDELWSYIDAYFYFAKAIDCSNIDFIDNHRKNYLKHFEKIQNSIFSIIWMTNQLCEDKKVNNHEALLEHKNKCEKIINGLDAELMNTVNFLLEYNGGKIKI